jgi:hypothetical protein
MGKFVLKELQERIAKKAGGFLAERKESVLSKATAGSAFTLDQQYKLFFWGMNGFIKGKPNKKERLVWTALIENVVDSESTCDDSGFEGMKIKQRCHLIGKEKEVAQENIVWIEKELKPYFEDSMRKQLCNLSDLSLNKILKGEITESEAKAAYGVYSKNQDSFKGALK